jgi:two-component system phosphate regulon response regulator PhoB
MTDAVPHAGSSSAPTILVLDDDDQVRQMLCVALQVAGFETREAATPSQAYRTLSGDKLPAAMMISLQNAATQGLDVLRYLRAHENLAEMPIVFLGVQSTEDLRWHALKLGADWFALKPLSLRELQQHVGDLVRLGRPRQRLLRAVPNERHRLAG